jgi:hypothetical protein
MPSLEAQTQPARRAQSGAVIWLAATIHRSIIMVREVTYLIAWRTFPLGARHTLQKLESVELYTIALLT